MSPRIHATNASSSPSYVRGSTRINASLTTSGGGSGPPFSNLKSLVFDGVDEYLNVGSGASLNVNYSNTRVSCGIWFYATALANLSENILFSNAQNTTAPQAYRGLMFLVNGFLGQDLALYLTSNYDTGNGISGGVAFVFLPNTWYHVGFTSDGSGTSAGIKMYINGVAQTIVFDATHITATSVSSNPMLIGSANSGSFGHPFQGNLDEPFFINGTTLSDADFLAIYNGGSPKSLITYAPTSWWRDGDGDTYPTILDQVGTNNGTMINMEAGDIVAFVPP